MIVTNTRLYYMERSYSWKRGSKSRNYRIILNFISRENSYYFNFQIKSKNQRKYTNILSDFINCFMAVRLRVEGKRRSHQRTVSEQCVFCQGVEGALGSNRKYIIRNIVCSPLYVHTQQQTLTGELVTLYMGGNIKIRLIEAHYNKLNLTRQNTERM